jgi:tetratricopeptide (TPR) repeat protein
MNVSISNTALLNHGGDAVNDAIKMIQKHPAIEIIVRLNNLGVTAIERSEHEAAGNFLRRALDKAEHRFDSILRSPIQSNNNQVSRSLYVYQRGEYDEGMHTFSVPIVMDAATTSLPNAILTVLFNMGQLYLRTNQNEAAAQAFMRALQLINSTSPTSKLQQQQQPAASSAVSLMAVLHNIGHVQYRTGQYEDAVRTYAKALQWGKHAFHGKTCHNTMLEVAATLNCLGVLYFHLPKAETEKAMELYLESLAIQKNIFGEAYESKEVATTLNNIGRIHYMKGEHEQALELYNTALQMRRRLLGPEHLDVAATIYNAGQTHHQRGNLVLAMELYEEFLSIARKRLGKYHRDVAIMLKCMAQIHHEKKSHDTAAALYREALVVGKSALGNFHPEVASTLNKLGNLYYEQGDFENALKVYKEGLEVERAVLDVFHPNVVVTLTK